MPRPPKNYSPLREIREKAGLNQAQMAELMQVSKPAVVKLENDQRKLQPYYCYLVSTLTGADIEADPEAEDGLLIKLRATAGGEPYERRHYDQRRDELEARLPAKALAEATTALIDVLFKTCAKTSSIPFAEAAVVSWVLDFSDRHKDALRTPLHSVVYENEAYRGLSQKEKGEVKRLFWANPREAGEKLLAHSEAKRSPAAPPVTESGSGSSSGY